MTKKRTTTKPTQKSKEELPVSDFEVSNEEAAEILGSLPDEPKPAPQSKGPSKPKSYVVAVEFRDIDSFSKVWHVGADVGHFQASRLERLIKLGYVVEQ